MSNRQNLDIFYDELAQQVLALMNSKNVDAWHKGWQSTSLSQRNAVSEKLYRGANQLKLMLTSMLNGYTDERWLTFLQAKELGGGVKRGEKGVSIITPQEWDVKEKNWFSKKTVENLSEEEASRYRSENVVLLYQKAVLFNVLQCENLQIKAEDKKAIEQTGQVNEQLEDLLRLCPVEIVEQKNGEAYYSLDQDKIYIPAKEDFYTLDDYYGTVLHELAHSTGHAERLKRNFNNAFGTEDYAYEELVAEFASIFLQGSYGQALKGKHIENHTAYIKAWSKKIADDNKYLVRAIADAKLANNFVLNNFALGKDTLGSKEKHKEKKSAQFFASPKSTKTKAQRRADIAKNVPDELKRQSRWATYWVNERFEDGKLKKDKLIMNATAGAKGDRHACKWAKCTDTSTMTDFETALAFGKVVSSAGLSYGLLAEDGITCIDLDDCVKEDGTLNGIAREVLSLIPPTYLELSTSGKGLHIFLKGDILDGGKYKNRASTPGGELEVYSHKRFISMTGDVPPGYECNVIAQAPPVLVERLRGKLVYNRNLVNSLSARYTPPTTAHCRSDKEVEELILRSKKRYEYQSLMEGVSSTGDHSRDDMKLLHILAFFTNGDRAQMESMFMRSKLYRPSHNKRKYLEYSINKAINTLTKGYDENYRSKQSKQRESEREREK